MLWFVAELCKFEILAGCGIPLIQRARETGDATGSGIIT